MLSRLKSLFSSPDATDSALVPVARDTNSSSQKDTNSYGIFLILSTLPIHLKLLLFDNPTSSFSLLSSEGLCVSLLGFCGALSLLAAIWGKYSRIDNLLWAYSTLILAIFAGIKDYRFRVATEFTGYKEPEERTGLCTLCVLLAIVPPATAVATNLFLGDSPQISTWLRYVMRLNVLLTFPVVSLIGVYYQLQAPLECAIMSLPAVTSFIPSPKVRLIIFYTVVAADLKFLGNFPSAFLATFPVVFSLMPEEYLFTFNLIQPKRYLSSEIVATLGGIFWCWLSHASTSIVFSTGCLLSHVLWSPFVLLYAYFVARGQEETFAEKIAKQAKLREEKKEDPPILYSPNARGGIQGLGGGPGLYADKDGDTAHDFYEANDTNGELKPLPRSTLHPSKEENKIY